MSDATSRRYMMLLSSVAVVLMLLCTISCEDDNNKGRTGLDRTRPVLSVTPIELTGPFDGLGNRYGDVLFDYVTPVIPFGAILGSGATNPAIEYYTIPIALVRSCCAGVVVQVFQNEGLSDFEIHIRTSSNNAWNVQYDHVLDPTVTEGSVVVAGEVLGGSGEWSGAMRRTELAVSDTENGDLSYCPLDFGDDDFVARHEGLMDALNDRGFGPFESLCAAETVVP